jgi:hypothetical protein|tara:strand:+ start:1036 stop:1734 length:699 start_codon:yes stop_codon:yes gene_type:complete
MSYGMQIYSANGALQLDTTDSSHILYQKHSSGTSSAITNVGTGSGSGYYYGWQSVTVSGFSTGEDLVFIQPTGSADVKAYVMPTSNGFTIFSNTNVSFYWYTFKKVTSLSDPTSTYGIEVYDASGNVVFNQDVLAARIKGRITGSGSISLSGKSLYALGTFKYSAITAAFAPRRGKIYGWVHTWNAARDQVSFGSAYISGQGYQASSEGELDAATYIDNSLVSTLIVEAPDP